MNPLKIQTEYEMSQAKTFRIPVAFVEKLEQLAKQHNTSMNKVVIQCLEFALQNLDESEFD